MCVLCKGREIKGLALQHWGDFLQKKFVKINNNFK
jgi:hypothetical protein